MLCSLCGASRIKKKFSKLGRDYYSCADCGLVFIHPQPSDDELRAIYTKDYYAPWFSSGSGEALVRRSKTMSFSGWLDRAEKFGHRGRILDIGCAFGLFLEVASRRGWDVYGLELAGYSADIAGSRFPGKIFKGELFSAHYPDADFDAVTMFDVIEHVRAPGLFLAEVNRILKPSGLVVFTTVNAASLSATVMGSRWPHYKTEHLFYFDRSNLSRLLEKSGFEPLYSSGAGKYLSFEYISSYLRTYPQSCGGAAVKALEYFLPPFLREAVFPAETGEMLVIARKKKR